MATVRHPLGKKSFTPDPVMEGFGVDNKEVLLKVKMAQRDRALSYSAWERAYTEYLQGRSAETSYSEACSAAQKDLQTASSMVIHQITRLKSSRDTIDWAIRLQQLQDFERKKLELVGLSANLCCMLPKRCVRLLYRR
jgi:hypothetical protein